MHEETAENEGTFRAKITERTAGKFSEDNLYSGFILQHLPSEKRKKYFAYEISGFPLREV